MRNTIVISLLILFTTSQAGYYCVYSFQQSQIKKEVKEHLKEMLPESSLKIIAEEDNAGAIKWQEQNKEFIFHAELYDVVKIKKVCGKTLLYCLNDKEEEKLLHEFAKALKSAADNNAKGKNGNANHKLQFNNCYFLNNAESITATNFTKCCKYLFFASSLTSSAKEVNAPPPRV